MKHLTPNQQVLLRLLAHNIGNRDIAHILDISERTVPGLVTTLLEKCGLVGRHQAHAYLTEQLGQTVDMGKLAEKINKLRIASTR